MLRLILFTSILLVIAMSLSSVHSKEITYPPVQGYQQIVTSGHPDGSTEKPVS